MDLRVRDVYYNIAGTGSATDELIESRPISCKQRYKLGHDTCGTRHCDDCFNTLIIHLEREDNIAQKQQEEWNEEEESGCDGCNGESCEYCANHDEWSDN